MAARKKPSRKPRVKTSPKPESSFRSAVLGLLVLSAFAIGFYSIQTYNKTEIETVTIPGVEHVHATLDVTICGKQFNLPADTGDLENSHTHKEENLLHWHAKSNTENVRNMKYVESALLKDKIPQTCAKTPGKLSLTVNGERQEDSENYIWKDGDKLELTFE